MMLHCRLRPRSRKYAALPRSYRSFCIQVEFKIVQVSGSEIKWEPGQNRNLLLKGPGAVRCEWGEDEAQQKDAGREDHKPVKEQSSSGGSNGSDRAGAATSQDYAQNSWQGKEISFMQSNEHSRERNGVWDATGLSEPALGVVTVRGKVMHNLSPTLEL